MPHSCSEPRPQQIKASAARSIRASRYPPHLKTLTPAEPANRTSSRQNSGQSPRTHSCSLAKRADTSASGLLFCSAILVASFLVAPMVSASQRSIPPLVRGRDPRQPRQVPRVTHQPEDRPIGRPAQQLDADPLPHPCDARAVTYTIATPRSTSISQAMRSGIWSQVGARGAGDADVTNSHLVTHVPCPREVQISTVVRRRILEKLFLTLARECVVNSV